MTATFRTWFAGATRHPVRTGEVAGRGEPLIAASVRLAGLDFIVTSQVSPVRWQPNREVKWELPGLKNLSVCVCRSVCFVHICSILYILKSQYV